MSAKRIRKWICCFATCFLALSPALGAPQDVKGWQSFTWGMTDEQIVRAGGGDVQRQERAWAPQRQFYVDYSVPALKLQDMQFKVWFQMDPATDTLNEIRLIDKSPALGQGAPRRREFDELEALLTQKYGPAQLRTDLDEGRSLGMPMVTLTRTWAFPTTSIELRLDWFAAPGSAGAGSTTVRYFPTKRGDASKL